MRVALVLVLLAATLAAPPAAVNAAERVLPDRAFSGPGWKFNDVETFRLQFRQAQRRFRHAADGTLVAVPQVVFVSPGRCWQSGYWDYAWVPQSYAYNAWVPGGWAPDGSWVEAHYESTWYGGGYYQPLWVEGYWTPC